MNTNSLQAFLRATLSFRTALKGALPPDINSRDKEHVTLGITTLNEHPEVLDLLKSAKEALAKAFGQAQQEGLFSAAKAILSREMISALSSFHGFTNSAMVKGVQSNQDFNYIARSPKLTMKTALVLVALGKINMDRSDPAKQGQDNKLAVPLIEEALVEWEKAFKDKSARVYTATLDALAPKLEAAGMSKLAANLDTVSNSLEAAQ